MSRGLPHLELLLRPAPRRIGTGTKVPGGGVDIRLLCPGRGERNSFQRLYGRDFSFAESFQGGTKQVLTDTDWPRASFRRRYN